MADGQITRNGATIEIDENGGVIVEPAAGEDITFQGDDTGTNAVRDTLETDSVNAEDIDSAEGTIGNIELPTRFGQINESTIAGGDLFRFDLPVDSDPRSDGLVISGEINGWALPSGDTDPAILMTFLDDNDDKLGTADYESIHRSGTSLTSEADTDDWILFEPSDGDTNHGFDIEFVVTWGSGRPSLSATSSYTQNKGGAVIEMGILDGGSVHNDATQLQIEVANIDETRNLWAEIGGRKVA